MVSILHPDYQLDQADACTITKALAWLGQYLSPTSANTVEQASAKFGLVHDWKHHLEMKIVGCLFAKTTSQKLC